MLREAYAHDVFLQPSVTERSGDTEGGAPVSIIEMLASGMPVIGTTHCDIPEVVGPALQGFLAPERDSAALADCLRDLLNQSSDWPSLARDARRRLEQEYDARRQAERVVLHYCQLAGKR
jgi:colanic acid/amylovoran biosynthesis glycosyltransferase